MWGTNQFCLNCHQVGQTKQFIKGSFFLEVFLWLCFIVPGVAYSLWRLSDIKYVCRVCESDQIVPLDSERAQAILKSISTRKEAIK